MNRTSILTLSVVAAAIVAGCSSMPATNASVEQARSDLRMAQDTPQTRDLAVIEMKQAGDAVALATTAWNRGDDVEEIDHLAQLARTRVAIATEVGKQKAAEAAAAKSNAARDTQRLAARTMEADAAKRDASMAQRDASAAQRDAALAQRETAIAQSQAGASRRLAGDAEARSAALQAQMQAMNATETERGMVITIGDVLFDTNRSDMKSAGARGMDKLVAFMKQNPQRKAVIEGFTDSTGSDQSNQLLSTRRAESVRMALVDMGVPRDRLSTQGYGMNHPVADNDSASGRQRNRRVEIVLSDDNGRVGAR